MSTNHSISSARAEAQALATIPRGPDDEPVFRQPWEAKAFALVVQLSRQGHFTWKEWAEQLGSEIAAAGPADDGRDYYLLWLAAAEKLVGRKGLCADGELATRKSGLAAAQSSAAVDAP
ncbi:MAG: nitrile hydratase accessory protein [Gammaproteobacteria bacterium]